MKSLTYAIIAATVIAAPVASFAQSDSPVTRAEVRAELTQLEQAGYHVGDGDQASYPTNIQAAEARIAARNGATAYGGTVSGSATSGPPASKNDLKSLYFGQ
ncbi:membrane protein [Caballeronia glebae]|uniref:Membrane protein n=1 Tax=Caballeronia glebae TaxID=1777143 RepID=A0A158BKL5_9BURK|nr:DUF4148 domain-containing protein [Caballeronia glebae]SAK70510.1 membrane protein [Caballeronia glebae]